MIVINKLYDRSKKSFIGLKDLMFLLHQVFYQNLSFLDFLG